MNLLLPLPSSYVNGKLSLCKHLLLVHSAPEQPPLSQAHGPGWTDSANRHTSTTNRLQQLSYRQTDHRPEIVHSVPRPVGQGPMDHTTSKQERPQVITWLP